MADTRYMTTNAITTQTHTDNSGITWTTDRWTDEAGKNWTSSKPDSIPSGKLWIPGTTILLTADEQVEDDEPDDTCHCGHPDCGAC